MSDLYLGDCLEILPTLAERSVDAIITDLPYGTTACKWDVIIPLVPMWEQVKRLCKGAFVTTSSQPFTSVLIGSNLKWFRYSAVWGKGWSGGFGVVKYRLSPEHEDIVLFSKNGHTYNPQMREGKPYKEKARIRKNKYGNPLKFGIKGNLETINNGTRYPSTILDFPVSMQECNNTTRVHPTQKPVALYEYLIKTYTNEGDTVLDFCMGSGTTGVACVKTNRNFIGIEREQNYFEIAKRRIEQEQQQMKLELICQ